MSDESLDGLFSDEQVEQESPPEVQQDIEPEANAEQEQVTGEDAAPPAAESEPEKEEWTKQAVIDERRKRQALEDQLRAMQGEIERMRNPQPEAPKRPDLFEDPDGALSYLENTFEQKLAQRTAEMSVSWAQAQYPDYAEKEAVFVDLAKADTTGQLLRQLRNSANPAAFAYETAKKAMQYQEMQDIDGYKAKIEADIRARIEAEYAGRIPKAQDEPARDAKGKFISPSLATARAAAPNKEVGNDSLSDLARLG